MSRRNLEPEAVAAQVAEQLPSVEPEAQSPPTGPTLDEQRAALRAEIHKARKQFITGSTDRDGYLTEELERRAASRVADRIEELQARLAALPQP